MENLSDKTLRAYLSFPIKNLNISPTILIEAFQEEISRRYGKVCHIDFVHNYNKDEENNKTYTEKMGTALILQSTCDVAFAVFEYTTADGLKVYSEGVHMESSCAINDEQPFFRFAVRHLGDNVFDFGLIYTLENYTHIVERVLKKREGK